MRRVLLILLFIILISNLFATNTGIVPFTGAMGVNMASKYYQGTVEGFNNSGTTVFKSTTINTGFANGDYSSKSYYCNDHIIAIGGVYEFNDREIEGCTITVNCAEGFYFRSTSNPNSIRPFEIIVVPRFRVTSGIGAEETNSGNAFKIDDASNNISHYIKYQRPGSFLTYSHSDMWFDIILVLPLDEEPIPNSNYIVANGIRYPLIPADDYSATVTIAVECDGVASSTISIPFSGYYSGTVNEYDKQEGSVSLRVNTMAAGANLDIHTQAGTPVEIASVDFMYEVTSGDYSTGWWGTESQTFSYDDRVKIFLSASNNPFSKDSDGFELVHETVRAGTSNKTNFNSIGFEIIARGDEGNIGSDTATGFTPPGSVYKSRVFDGTDYVTVDGSLDNAIFPVRIVDNSVGHLGGYREYFTYQGQLDVVIDEPVVTMLPGRYTEKVYIHVVSDDEKMAKAER